MFDRGATRKSGFGNGHLRKRQYHRLQQLLPAASALPPRKSQLSPAVSGPWARAAFKWEKGEEVGQQSAFTSVGLLISFLCVIFSGIMEIWTRGLAGTCPRSQQHQTWSQVILLIV